MKKHKVFKRLALIVTLIFILLFISGWAMFGTQLQAAATVRKLADGLYCMEYQGDYGFDEFLAQGGAATDSQMGAYITTFLSHGFWTSDAADLQKVDFGCSTLSAQLPAGGTVYGRNYDWQAANTLVLHTVPQNGYESVSTCCLPFLGFGEDWAPEGFSNRFLALAAVYVPLDGMNSAGLCIADLMDGDGEPAQQNTEKPDLTTVSAIRLLLDKAATVDEAVALLEQYDMHASIGSAHHFSIADASGRAVVVEYLGGEMFVTETQAVTNHALTQGRVDPSGSAQSFARYQVLQDCYTAHGGNLTCDEMRDALQSVCQANFRDSEEITVWSIVFDTAAHTARYYWQEDYSGGWTVTLGEETWMAPEKSRETTRPFDHGTHILRVQEKCGFRQHPTEKDCAGTPMQDMRTEHFTCITKRKWLARTQPLK